MVEPSPSGTTDVPLAGATAETTGGTAPSGYFATRLAQHPERSRIWGHICDYLARWIPADSAVLELGAGWCDFANQVTARRVVAFDQDPTVRSAAAEGVEAVIGDATDLAMFGAGEFDVVMASNLLEHLDRPACDALLDEAARVLAPTGHLLLVQPNFRLNPGRYFDDYTHVAIFTDQSLGDYLTSRGWTVRHREARFLPLTMKSRASSLSFLVPFYLRSPIRPLAGQMLFVASPPTGPRPV